jgi:hypothetical protein
VLPNPFRRTAVGNDKSGEKPGGSYPSPVPGENVFSAIVHNAAGTPTDNRTFSLLAF